MALDYNTAVRRLVIHKNLAHVLIMLIGLFAIFGSRDQLLGFLFFALSQVYFYGGIITNKTMQGYGVAVAINEIARAEIVAPRGLAWRGVATEDLMKSWGLTLGLYTALGAAAGSFLIWPQGSMMDYAATGFLVVVAARLIALAGEVYVWVAADRHRHWYLHEQNFRKGLVRLGRPQRAIDHMVDRAKKQHLLIS